MINSREVEEERLNLFAYGSLTNQDFVMKLLGRQVEMIDARLYGYKKIKPSDWSYEVAVKEQGSVLEGKLLVDLTSEELEMINIWETHNLSMEDILKHRNEIWKMIRQKNFNRLETIAKKIKRYQRILEKIIIDGKLLKVFVYVYPQT